MTKILLVEDDKSLREIYGVRLLAEGYDIVSAGDGEEALAMAIKERPDLIVSDVMMPKISGFDMLDILRSTTETKNIKVIMMTALSSDDQRERGESLGADRYLVKSQVGIEDVVRTVHEVLGDAPVAGPTGGNAFASPRGPQPQPAPGARPMPTPGARPQPARQQPQAPQPQPPVNPQAQAQPAPAPQRPSQPASPPTPQPAAPQTSPAPVPAGAPQKPPVNTDNGLPQPTAPFSTPRPIGLGDRIIQPLQRPNGPSDMSNRIAEELRDTPAANASSQPQAPTQPPATPPTPPPPASTPQPQSPPEPKPNLAFEETPRPNPPLPPNGPDTQPPRPQQ